MILAKYSVDPQGFGLLKVLFPEHLILLEPLPAFVGRDDLIVVSERNLDFYPRKRIIQITRAADVRLTSREGFLEFLKQRGIKITVEQQERMREVEDEEFWRIGKQMHVVGHYVAESVEAASSVYHLFVNLYEDFSITYKCFVEAKQSHRMVFSALLTMTLKTQQIETLGVSPSYKKALMKNAIYYSFFRRAVLDYIETEMEENDFMAFLLQLSSAKSGKV